MKKSKTIVVNFLSGPGAGKSTMAAATFAELKWMGINCELVGEFAKDLVWEKRFKTFTNQVYLFGKQHHRIHRLLGEVDVIVTDSPIVLTPMYDAEKREMLAKLVMNEYAKSNNINFFIKRFKKYNPKGRNQTEKEAKVIDRRLKDFLNEQRIQYFEVDGKRESIAGIANVIKVGVEALHEGK